MSPSSFDVCSLGNALVDLIFECDDDFLEKQNLAKGGMTLIDEPRAKELSSLLKPSAEMAGGSAANTIVCLASLGGKPAFIAKTSNDFLGDLFKKSLHDEGVHFTTAPLVGGAATGRCLSFVTPDAQRTMCTFLGASTEFADTDIDADLIKASQITYLEGYLYDRPAAQAAFIKAADIAHKAGKKMALSLSDSFCIQRHRAEFIDLVKHVDILFANEAEILELYQTSSFEDAVLQANTHSDLVVVTRGAQGAFVSQGTTKHQQKAIPIQKLVDTTGAGDSFAAGFLYGLTQGKDIAECSRIATIAAAEVIGHYGSRPTRPLKELI